jgi:signal transduction histidine kinase
VPVSAYLLLNPFLAYAVGVDAISWASVAAVLMVLAQSSAAWVRYGGAVAAEAAARAEAERRRNDAESAAAAKSAFVATISHELRTPLSGIMAASAQLQRHGRGKAEQEAVEVLTDAGAFMKTLLDDLLDLAKLEAGRMTVEAVQYDLGDLVWKLERHWSAAARGAESRCS